MFDFSRSTIGTMPNEDIYARGGPESQWGINPGMRSSMNLRDALEQGKEASYLKAAGGGMNPVQLALMDPERYYQKTGQSLFMNEGQPIWYSPGTPGAQEEIMSGVRSMNNERALKNSMAISELTKYFREGYNDPVKTAMASLDPETARRVGLLPYTKEYGDPSAGIPTGYAREIGKQREQNVPALTQVEAGMKQFGELAPGRAEEVRKSQETTRLSERKQNIDALVNQYEALAKIAANAVQQDPAVLNQMDHLLTQIAEFTGTKAPQSLGPPPANLLLDAAKDPGVVQAPKGSTFLLTDQATGLKYRVIWDGKKLLPTKAFKEADQSSKPNKGA